MAGIDLDGSLLTSSKEVTEFSEEILREACEKGVYIVPVTGRPLSGLPSQIAQLRTNSEAVVRYVITSNGACIYRRKSSVNLIEDEALSEWEMISGTLMKPQIVRSIFEVIGDASPIVEVFACGWGFHEHIAEKKLARKFEGTPVMGYIIQSRKCTEDMQKLLDRFEKEGTGIENISLMFDNEEECRRVYSRLSQLEGIQVIEPKNTDLEIISADTDKGKALLSLSSMLGIEREEILAIGDNDNDRGLLRTAGMFVAMKNATPWIREAADYVTEDNDHDGAAKAICKFCI